MGDNTLEGYAAAEFGKVANPVFNLRRPTHNLNSNTTQVGQRFSMPSGYGRINVRSAYVADGQGDAISGLSLILKDEDNDTVIHSETSAQVQTGGAVDSPLATAGVSAGTKVGLLIKNESGANLTGRGEAGGQAPSGQMVIDFE